LISCSARKHATKRSINRSELGRQCRDTFISLKKTCRKLGVSFWDYLNDRISQADRIPGLPNIIEARTVPA
jgi:hypothetical protein